MKNKQNIIIEAIKQDMRFNQYISALRELGIEAYNFDLDLMGIVAKLMKVNITDSWMELYVTELNKCECLPIKPMGENLNSLAEVCYHILLNFKEHDDDVGGALS